MNRISFEDKPSYEAKTDRDSLSEGDSVIVDWDPYKWATDNEGYVGRFRATIEDIHEFSGDITIRADTGEKFKDLGEGRREVMGRAENTEDIPDWTDVGSGMRYYPDEQLNN